MRYIIVTMLLLVGISNTFSQPVSISYEEMLEDFDSLQYTITKYCSFIPLLEERTGISVGEELKNLKQEITPNTTLKEFVEIVRQGLNTLNDGHTQITNSSSVKWFATSRYNYLSSVGNVTLADTLLADFYHKYISDSVFVKSQSGIRAKYIDGRYYNTRCFFYDNEPINLGDEIKAINKVEINDFIQKHYQQMFYLRWDSENKLFYSDLFMLALPLMGMDRFTLTIGDRGVVIDSRETADSLKRENYQPRFSPQMTTIGDSILYIFMPMMIDQNWYISNLKETYKQGVDKIIIDIRGNGGGDDNVWTTLLQQIISEPFGYHFSVGMNHCKLLEKSISGFGDLNVRDNLMTVSSDRVIYPDSNSINFTGRLYLIQDEGTYSAASAFVSAAMQNKDKITVIGKPSALISGYTFPAIVFKLPNSKIAYRLAFSYDLSGGTENPYMDRVDIEIKESINEYLNKLYEYNPSNVQEFINRDPVIQYIINY